MATADLHLSVHLGHRWTTAAVTIGGRTWTVTFEGQTRIPSAVAIDAQTGATLVGSATADPAQAYLSDPMAALRTSGEADTQPMAAVSALLAYAANAASTQANAPVAALTVTTPQPWGPKSRQRLTQAATTAGLPEPAIVTAAAAAAATASVQRVEGQRGPYVLVCLVEDDCPRLALLDVANQYAQLAAASAQDPDAPGIHRALAVSVQRRSGGDDISTELDWRIAGEIDRARMALAGADRTAVLLPEQPSPVVMDAADLQAAAQPHLKQLGPAVTQILADADIDLADVTAAVLVAYDGTVPDVQAALTDAGLPAPSAVTQPEQLAVGAARLTAGTRADSGLTAATTRLPRARLTLRSLTGVAAFAATAVALLLQTITTADIGSSWGGDTRWVRLPVENIALAAVLAATAAAAAAQLAPTTWLSPRGMADTVSTGWLLRRSYFAAAAASLALAGLFGLGTGVGVGLSDPRYLRWAVTAAAPIAVCAAIIALASPHIPSIRLTAWLRGMHPPIWPIVTAATGVYLVQAAYTLTFPVNFTGNYVVVAAAGAAILGVATAATVTRHLGIRIAIGLILVPGYALIVTVPTMGYLTIAYIAALLWWYSTATADTVRAATPHDHPVTRWLPKS
ncbi:hypothetical protein OHA21_00300 [Actinoplanes sp. NBC_00393]|uniref:hypothetical protein n=1 Tax=Actinoplanes sp. NBC_00393 TaxID=2975953 RepID=UPI002E235D7E